MLMAVCHSEDAGWATVDDLASMSDLRAAPGNLLWAEADVATMTANDWAVIQEEFGLHDLAMEDAKKTRERPKLESFHDHIFVVFHQLDEEHGQVEARQVACFVGEGYVLTLHESAHRTLDEAKGRWGSGVHTARRGRTYLMHLLLDVVVDEYQAIADRLEDEIESLEEQALESPDLPQRRAQRARDRAAQLQLYSVKQRLSRLRRYALPMSRILEGLGGDTRDGLLPEETALLFRDVSDHLQRITDQIRNVDELASAVLDLRHSEQGASLNEINKKLTAWAAIIAVPTLISSTYGMNFRLVPADQELFGFWFALTTMASTAVGLYVYFRRKGWL